MRHDAAFRVEYPFCCVVAETATSSSPRSMSCMHNHHYVAQIVVSCGIGHIPVRLEVLITWSRPNSDLQRVGSGLLKNHKNSLFVWKFHSTFANWYGLFKRTIKATTFWGENSVVVSGIWGVVALGFWKTLRVEFVWLSKIKRYKLWWRNRWK